MAHQALYLRYRPKTFAQVKGQQHVVKALQTAVRDGTVGHAYLLHGPRGTGKTTTARLLAKALNCTDLASDGEPCGSCESCVSVEENRSFDLHELDAASNNKVDDMRSLLERVSLTTPGQAKVYLLDEVHMLTSGAENALLKTLEEPPDHVTWVMATTEPHKVAQTIRSRCQVFELGLLNADLMKEHVRYVVADAGLDVSDEVIDYVVAVGAGSVRDTLSALDGVVPGAELMLLDTSTDDILSAVIDKDPAAALSSVGNAIGRGRTPRTIGESVLAGLRDGFLTKMGVPPPRLSDSEQARAADVAARLKPAAMTKALETLGRALIDMRQAPEPRVDIEVALVRLCQLEDANSVDVLSERLNRLEAKIASRLSASPSTQATPSGQVPPPPPPIPRRPPPASNVPPVPPPPVPPPGSGHGVAATSNKPGRRDFTKAKRALDGRSSSSGTAGRPVAGSSSAQHTYPRQTKTPGQTKTNLDLASLRPQTPTEVVELAKLHLGLSKPTVVARAKEMLTGRRGQHRPADLLRLWHALINDQSSGSDAPTSSATNKPPSVTHTQRSVTDEQVAGADEERSVGYGEQPLATENPLPTNEGQALMGDGQPVANNAELFDTDEAEQIDLNTLDDTSTYNRRVDAGTAREEVETRRVDASTARVDAKIAAAFPGAQITVMPDQHHQQNGDR